LPLIVFTFGCSTLLFIFLYLSSLLSEFPSELSESFLKTELFFFQHSLSVNELEELGSSKDDRMLQIRCHKVASPVVFTDNLFLLLFNICHVIYTFVVDFLLEFINPPLDLFFLYLLPLIDNT
jgi:hypothetical protein